MRPWWALELWGVSVSASDERYVDRHRSNMVIGPYSGMSELVVQLQQGPVVNNLFISLVIKKNLTKCFSLYILYIYCDIYSNA